MFRKIPDVSADETSGATFFDLSPAVIEGWDITGPTPKHFSKPSIGQGKSTQGKTGSALLVYKVFICAQAQFLGLLTSWKG